MKYLLLTILVLSVHLFSFGQLEEVKIETKNGQRVYVHVVQKGNTLWGLHRLYDVPVEKIIQNNPGVESGLIEGNVVYVPVPIITDEKIHVVASGETLYAIAKKYDVDVKELAKWNPESETGLKEGQKLKIFKSTYVTGEKAEKEAVEEQVKNVQPITVTFNDSIVEHKVAQGETLYSISRRYLVSQDKIISFNNKKNNNIKPGEILKIPLKKERVSKVDVREIPSKELDKKVDNTLLFKKKDEYHVAIMLPFYLNKGAGYSEGVANMSAEFLMGAQMAIDSLKRIGLNATVYVYDTENNLDKIKSIFAKPEFK